MLHISENYCKKCFVTLFEGYWIYFCFIMFKGCCMYILYFYFFFFFWKIPKYAKKLVLIYVFLFWALQLKAQICLEESFNTTMRFKMQFLLFKHSPELGSKIWKGSRISQYIFEDTSPSPNWNLCDFFIAKRLWSLLHSFVTSAGTWKHCVS